MQRTDVPGSAWRSVALRLLVVAGAIALGLFLQQRVALRLEELDALAKTDLLRARAELATLLRLLAVGAFGLTGAVGVIFARTSRRAAGRRLANLGVALGVLLAAASAAGAALLFYAAAVVAACRAGVPGP